MSSGVLVALAGDLELAVVGAVEHTDDLVVVRRCADIPELLAAALAGLGSVAVIDAELEPDRSLVARLTQTGTRTLVVCPPSAAERYMAMGTDPVSYDTDIDGIVTAIRGAAATAPVVVGMPEAEPDEPEDRPAGGMVAVTGAAGAPGRTTIAVNLAAELAATGRRVLLIDADVWGASVAQALGVLEESAGLAAAVRAADQGTLEAGTLARLCVPVTEHVRVLPGLPRAARWREVSGVSIDNVWEHARLLADWVIVDGPVWVPDDDRQGGFDSVLGPRRNGVLSSLLAAADHSVIVGAAEPIGIQRLVQTLLDTDERGEIGGRRHVVVSRVRSDAAGPRPADSVREALHRFAGVEGAHLIPDDRQGCDRAQLVGASLVETAPDSAARQAIRDMAHAVTGVPLARRSNRRRRRSRART